MKTGKVYKIVAGQGTECYVGSTRADLRIRMFEHRRKYRAWKKGKNDKRSVFELFEKYGVENCRMVLIKEYDVVDKRHLEVYETLWMKKLRAINKLEPCGGLLKKEHQKQYGKQYREANLEMIGEKKKQYRKANLEMIGEKKKQYYKTNAEMISEKQKQYYKTNKERLKEYQKQYNQIQKEIKQLMHITI
jgi:tRNA nucleotidyltransferase/poly(A) polymerase